jgi:hypothetical protein
VPHSKSIAFCADCQRPISAGATRCSRCAGAASRGVARGVAAPPSRRPQAEPRRERWRALTDAEQAAIRTAEPAQSDVALAWRYGVSAAEIARIRCSDESSANASPDPGRHSA